MDTLKLYVLLIVFGVPQVVGAFLIAVPFSRRSAEQIALVFVGLFLLAALLNTLRLLFYVILWLSEYEREKGWRWLPAYVTIACAVALSWFVASAELNHENLRLTIFQTDELVAVAVLAFVGFFVMRLLVDALRLSVAWALTVIVGAAVAFVVLQVPRDNPKRDRFTEVSELPRTIAVPHPERGSPWVLFVRLTPDEWRVRQIALVVAPAFLGALLGGVPASVWRRIRRLKPKTTDDTVREVYERMEPQIVAAIIGDVGAYMEARHGEAGRLSDLRWPAAAIEIAFMKALREWPDGPTLEAARAAYLMLDQWLLSDEECALCTEYIEHFQRAGDPNQVLELVAWSRTERGERAKDVYFRLLNEKMEKRRKLLDELDRQRNARRQSLADGAKSSPAKGSA